MLQLLTRQAPSVTMATPARGHWMLLIADKSSSPLPETLPKQREIAAQARYFRALKRERVTIVLSGKGS